MSPDEFVSALEHIESVAKVALAPGDTLVVRTARLLSPDEVSSVRSVLADHFPDNEILVTFGCELSVVHA